MSIDAILSAANPLRFEALLESQLTSRRIDSGANTSPADARIEGSQGLHSDRSAPFTFEGRLQEFIQRIKLENERLLSSDEEDSSANGRDGAAASLERAMRMGQDFFGQPDAAQFAESSREPSGLLNLLA